MCLAVEGKIIKVENFSAQVDFGGITREVRLDLTPEAKLGDIVLVHAGYALQVLAEDERRGNPDFLYTNS